MLASTTELRHQLNAILDRSKVGHDVHSIVDATDRLYTELGEAQAAALGSISIRHLTRNDSEIARAAAPPSREESSLTAYLNAHGLPPDQASKQRFAGSWCLWVRGADGAERQGHRSDEAIDSASYLRAELNAILERDRSRGGPAETPKIETVHRLMDSVRDWQATLLAHTSSKTLATPQIEALRETHPGLVDAALRSDRSARASCLLHINELELERSFRSDRPVTWSMWTSKGHAEDHQLVITRRAVDAWSHHRATGGDARTRYVSFDGAETPTRDNVLNRSIALMPSGSTIVVASDWTPEGRRLDQKACAIAGRYPGLSIRESHPAIGHSWNEQLTHQLSRFKPGFERGPAKVAPIVGLER